ncbi:nucleotide-binding alpha-beta plait domain-containing protein [Tanacetum coccineum]
MTERELGYIGNSKPCKCLWVTGISKYIAKEALRDEFSKFGEIEEFKFQWEKNAAIVDYFRLEDATKALEAMNGKKKRGTIMHVDYLRSQSRKANLPSEGQTEDEQKPSNILCISYPPVVHMDEQKLHNAMILFGEIEKITSFPSNLCSYVEFRSMEEANLAKERLQGKLFSDPRISITFSPNDPTANQTGGLPYQAIPHGVRPFVPPGSYDPSQIQREPKRLRTEGSMPYGEMNDRVLLANQISRGLVPSNTRFTNTSPNVIGSPDAGYIWRGIIAKGGNRICHARCVPVGDWIGYELEEDFASYTEFLRYMGDRNRAGVAKFDNGTTLFLVPPSDFLRRPQYTNTLQVPPTSNPLPMYYAPPAAETSAIPAADSLTPELLATLAALPRLTLMVSNYQASQPYQLDLHVVSGVMSSSQICVTNVSEPQGVVSGQQSSEFDAEKNEPYQSTLKSTSSRLLQIQQKQIDVKSSSIVKMNPDSVDKNDPKELQDEDIMYNIALSVEKFVFNVQISYVHVVDLNATSVVINRHVEDRYGGGGRGGGSGGGGGGRGGGGGGGGGRGCFCGGVSGRGGGGDGFWGGVGGFCGGVGGGGGGGDGVSGGGGGGDLYIMN